MTSLAVVVSYASTSPNLQTADGGPETNESARIYNTLSIPGLLGRVSLVAAILLKTYTNEEADYRIG